MGTVPEAVGVQPEVSVVLFWTESRLPNVVPPRFLPMYVLT
jgi:hypothetical protein